MEKEGVLESLILIGGWCQHIYRIHYDNTPLPKRWQAIIARVMKISSDKLYSEIIVTGQKRVEF